MEIKGLSKRQKQMLDIMWSLDSKEELYAWIDSLKSEREKRMAHVLLMMLMLEGIDNYIQQMDSYPEASDLLSNFMVSK